MRTCSTVASAWQTIISDWSTVRLLQVCSCKGLSAGLRPPGAIKDFNQVTRVYARLVNVITNILCFINIHGMKL